MGTPMRVELDDLVDGVLRIYLKSSRMLLDFKMAHAACSIASTIANPCVEHCINGRVLLKTLHDVAGGGR